MTFRIISGAFRSFASASDVIGRDPRFFTANEGIVSAEIDSVLEQASQRILTQIGNTSWWRDYQRSRNAAVAADIRALPAVNPMHILAREQDFKDLNVQFALAEYLYPGHADFGDETSAEVVKIAFYQDLYNKLFLEVISAGDWYDYSQNGTIALDEKAPVTVNRVRVR